MIVDFENPGFGHNPHPALPSSAEDIAWLCHDLKEWGYLVEIQSRCVVLHYNGTTRIQMTAVKDVNGVYDAMWVPNILQRRNLLVGDVRSRLLKYNLQNYLLIIEDRAKRDKLVKGVLKFLESEFDVNYCYGSK